MIVYNITLKVEPEIESEWLRWQREEHIPDILSTGIFTEHKFFKLLDQDETDGVTYVVQYFTPSRDNYNQYIEKFAPLLRKKASEKWGDRFIGFRTVMELVQ
jgi:hypothetical protein